MLHPSAIPLHYQLKELFVEKINNGEWPLGALIPTEAALCAVYAVSRGPVRQAIDQLVREGLLVANRARAPGCCRPKLNAAWVGCTASPI
jgi:DNA-binding GntR family transcriptional regulator